MASANTFTPQAGQAPASNVAAVCTMAAPTDGSRWILESISYSYTATPTNGTLTIVSDGVTETYAAPVAGEAILQWLNRRAFGTNKAVVITLSAGGSGISGTVYPRAWTGISG